MSVIIGLVIVFASMLGGFMMHGGNPAVLLQWSEFVIIGGAGLGAAIASTSFKDVIHVFKDCIALTKGSPYTKEAYSELLQVLYGLFNIARKEGNIGVEPHVENPASSPLFNQYPSFSQNTRAVQLLADTMKVTMNGAIKDYHLSEALDMDLDAHRTSALHSSHVLEKTGDAMPAFGIVAAVLGVVITMGKIGGPPEMIGASVGAALVGTLLGVLLAYGVFQPLAQAAGKIAEDEYKYLMCIRAAILSNIRGDAPQTAVEFARRNIDPSLRPSFEELETLVRSR